jgi:flagellar biosynthetic protein FlhB
VADKTEKATPKRQHDARMKGQVAKSMDLGGATVLLVGLMAITAFGPKMVESMKNFLTEGLRTAATPKMIEGPGMGQFVLDAAQVTFGAVLPVAGACAIGAAVIMAAQVGLKITPKAIKPDFKKMNPISNAKQTFGPNALVELVKNITKTAAVGIVVWIVLKPQVDDIGVLVGLEPEALGERILEGVVKIARAAAVAYFIIGVGDYVWQKHKLDKSLKMDLQEIKEEYKSSELPPEVRQMMKRRQMMASRARQMAAVPDADVVVTNPTHYAVALKYNPELAAPEVVAKGVDLVAAKIREAATEAGVPIIPDPPLARALHASVEVGEHIPEEMYEAVAAVLAFVYRTARRRAGV